MTLFYLKFKTFKQREEKNSNLKSNLPLSIVKTVLAFNLLVYNKFGCSAEIYDEKK